MWPKQQLVSSKMFWPSCINSVGYVRVAFAGVVTDLPLTGMPMGPEGEPVETEDMSWVEEVVNAA